MAFSKIILNGTTLIDLTQDTVAADNLLLSYTAHGADGQAIIGEASGSGGGSGVTQDEDGFIILPPTGGGGGGGGGSTGLIYESGSFTPVSDASAPTVTFEGTHTDPPIYMVVSDTEETIASTSSNLIWYFVNWYTANDAYVISDASTNYYGRVQFFYKTDTGRSYGQYDLTTLGNSSNTGLTYFVDNTEAEIYCGSPNRFFRSGRTYKWVAVWAT